MRPGWGFRVKCTAFLLTMPSSPSSQYDYLGYCIHVAEERSKKVKYEKEEAAPVLDSQDKENCLLSMYSLGTNLITMIEIGVLGTRFDGFGCDLDVVLTNVNYRHLMKLKKLKEQAK